MANKSRSQGISLAGYLPAILMGALALLFWALPFLSFAPHDYGAWLKPWYDHILTEGRIEAFAKPFSNYSPPYLYLLSAASLLNGIFEPLLVIRLLAVAGAAWAAFAIYALLRAAGDEEPAKAALWSLFLPTTVINVPILAQADTFWVAPCVLAVAAAIKRDTFWMVLWAGLAFAFKAQAIFIAPFVTAVLLRQRAPLWQWTIPVLIYSAAMFPAWLIGWPAADLATIYLRQANWAPPGELAFISNASNPWLIFKLMDPQLAARNFLAGYALAALATYLFWFFVFRRDLNTVQLIAAAALSACMLPWLLPGMHERFFALAEILSFCLAWLARDRNSIAIAFLLQTGLVLSAGGWFFDYDPAAVAGVVTVTGALGLILRKVVQPEGRDIDAVCGQLTTAAERKRMIREAV